MKKLILISLFFTIYSSVYSQYQDRYWIYGRTNFNGTTGNQTNVNSDFYPNLLNPYNTQNPPPMASPPSDISRDNGFESWSVVTNPSNGELVFYTDGEDVFDASHTDVIPTGGLGASPSSAQPVATCVVPVCPFNQYYIFSNPTGVSSGPPTTGPVTYRIYIPGTGFTPEYNLPGPSVTVGEGMVIIPSKTNPLVFWLITRDITPTKIASNYHVYKIDGSGPPSHHGVFTFGPRIRENPKSPIVNIAFRDDGSPHNVTVGFTVSGTTNIDNIVFTNQFDTNTGKFSSNAKTVAKFSEGTLYDLEFSPNGKYLYYATYYPSVLYQADLAGGTTMEMNDFGDDLRGGGLKIAPDGFIYHIANAGTSDNTGSVEIGRIVKPDLLSTGASNFSTMYESGSITQAHTFAYNFPEFVNTPRWSATVKIQGDKVICSGDKTKITTTTNSLGVAIQSYDWYYNGTFLTTTTTPSLTATFPGTYHVVVNLAGSCEITSNVVKVNSKDDCFCCEENVNLITNGNFNSGSTGFSSKYNYVPIMSPAKTDEVMPKEYSIVNSTDAHLICNQWNATDHTTCDDSGKFMVVNGNNGQQTSTTIWQTYPKIKVEEEEQYRFCANFKNLSQCCFDVVPEIKIKFSIPGYDTKVVLNSTNPAISCDWQRVEVNLLIPKGTTALDVKILLNEQTVGDGNDFAIDDISLQKLSDSSVFLSTNSVIKAKSIDVYASVNGVGRSNDYLPSPDCKYRWTVCELVSYSPIQVKNCMSGNSNNGWPLSTTFQGYQFTPPNLYIISLDIFDCGCTADKTLYSFVGGSAETNNQEGEEGNQKIELSPEQEKELLKQLRAFSLEETKK